MTSKLKALDLFCCAGGATRGLQQAGFYVTGVDLVAHKNYCGDAFIQGDALQVPLDGYDLIWASPPCQAFTNAQKIRGNAHPELVAPIRDRLRAAAPYVIENVPGAPLIDPVMLCGAMFGLKTYRHRLFEASFPLRQPDHPMHAARTAKMGRPPRDDEFMHVVGNFSGVPQAKAAMGIDWMNRDELREAIPPAYSRYIAEQFIKHREASLERAA